MGLHLGLSSRSEQHICRAINSMGIPKLSKHTNLSVVLREYNQRCYYNKDDQPGKSMVEKLVHVKTEMIR